MKTKKEVPAKGNKAEVAKESIDAATTKVAAKGAKEKDRPTTVKEKNFLYRFQLEEGKISPKQEKKNRNKIRRNLKLLVNKVIITKAGDERNKDIKAFIAFYKKEYILNDFSLKSLTNVSNEETIQDYSKVLELAKASLAK